MAFSLGSICSRSAWRFFGRFKHLQSKGRLQEFCNYAAECLSSCKPRVIKLQGDIRPVLIFTDASWEANVGGVGAVVIDTIIERASPGRGCSPVYELKLRKKPKKCD